MFLQTKKTGATLNLKGFGKAEDTRRIPRPLILLGSCAGAGAKSTFFQFGVEMIVGKAEPD